MPDLQTQTAQQGMGGKRGEGLSLFATFGRATVIQGLPLMLIDNTKSIKKDTNELRNYMKYCAVRHFYFLRIPANL